MSEAKRAFDALGLVEVVGLVPAVVAAAAALKSANVRLLKLYKVDAGIVDVAVTGDVGAVRAAISAAADAAGRLGPVRAAHVIARLHEQVMPLLVPPEAPPAPRPNISLRIGSFMNTIAQPLPTETVDHEGRPAEDDGPPTLAAVVQPEAVPEPPKRSRRKKTTDDAPSQ